MTQRKEKSCNAAAHLNVPTIDCREVCIEISFGDRTEIQNYRIGGFFRDSCKASYTPPNSLGPFISGLGPTPIPYRCIHFGGQDAGIDRHRVCTFVSPLENRKGDAAMMGRSRLKVGLARLWSQSRYGRRWAQGAAQGTRVVVQVRG